MRERDAPKAGWASSFPAGPPDKDGLARIVDADGGRDEAESSYYEEAAIAPKAPAAAWSRWRRRYQHRTRTSHYQRRQAKYHEVLLD